VPEISAEDGAQLVRLARAALEAAVTRQRPAVPPDTAVCARSAGAFVTLRQHGELRGCIGQIEPGTLGRVVVHCAAAAGLDDPRFPPVTPHELPSIDVEVSVLTDPIPVSDPITSIEVGRHGLIIARAGKRGLLLPQVAVEFGWSCDEFLAHTCRKAGLEPDAWQRGAQVLAFEAEIFTEHGPHG
jgi:uncharacterized protein